MGIDFRTLSDSLEANELEEYFVSFFDEYESKPKNPEALKQLHELAYRQWDTYEKLDESIAERAEAYLMSAMNLSSYDITDSIISIVENLSLKNVFDYLVKAKERVSAPSIRKLIQEAENEYSDTIDDPYGDFDDFL